MSFSQDKCTSQFSAALQSAISISKLHKNVDLAPLHFAYGLFHKPDSFGHQLLTKLATDQQNNTQQYNSTSGPLNPTQFINTLKAEIKKLPSQDPPPSSPHPNHALTNILDKSEDLRSHDKSSFIAADHAVLALYEDSKLSQLLTANGLPLDIVKDTISTMKRGKPTTSRDQEQTYDALTKYGRDLTELAAAGKLDPVIGRSAEINRLCQVLSRKRKNNPCLVSFPGSGKTSVVEGLALRIANKDVPSTLQNCKIIELSLVSLISGASARGEFEERLQAVVDEVTESNGEIVLFIDEIHMLVGAGAGSDSTMSASNILKPGLARGDLRMIGATTDAEFSKYIEKDPALERRFARVNVPEPTVEETINILRGIKHKYETYQCVTISDSALVAAAQLSDRYITQRYNPDKAIDLIDQASAKARVELDSKPVVMDELERKLVQLQIERCALEGELKRSEEKKKNSPDTGSPKPPTDEEKPSGDDYTNAADQLFGVEYTTKRLEQVNIQIEQIQTELAPIVAAYDAIHGKTKELQAAKLKLDEVQAKIDLAQRNKDLDRLSDLKYFVLPELKQKIAKLETAAKAQKELNNSEGNSGNTPFIVSDVVTADEIAAVVSTMTGIPVNKLSQTEKERYLKMGDVLEKKVVGQKDAVSAVCDAIIRSKAGFAPPGKPIASFFFLGATGTGKTLMAKTLAELLFDSEKALLRFDMSEFSESHSISKLIGAPPGYIGHDEGARLCDEVRRCPFQVILLDEVEKAHKAIHTLLLQLLDDGRLTDSKGNIVDFSNTIIIFTSNVGGQHLMDSIDPQTGEYTRSQESVHEEVLNAVKKSFPPEFLNRLSDMIVFKPLTQDHIVEIVNIALRQLSQRVKEYDLTITIDPHTVREVFLKYFFDPLYGGRPILRVMERVVVTKLSQLVLSGSLPFHSHVNITTNDALYEEFVKKHAALSQEKYQCAGISFADSDDDDFVTLLLFTIKPKNNPQNNKKNDETGFKFPTSQQRGIHDDSKHDIMSDE